MSCCKANFLCGKKKFEGNLGNKSYYFTFPIHFHSGANTPVRLLGVGLFSKTKTGIRKLRSFQRLITITLTNSFKTASTESLLVLAIVIPIDYHVLEIAAAHSFFVCDKIRPFSKSSLKLLAQRFPSIVSRNTAVKASSVYNSPVPP